MYIKHKRLAVILALSLCVPLAPVNAQETSTGRIRGAIVADLPGGGPIRIYIGRTHGDLILGRYLSFVPMPAPGPFVIDDVPAGSYAIAAYVDANRSGELEREIDPYASRRQVITVVAGQDTEPVVLDRWFNTEPRIVLRPELRTAFVQQMQSIYAYLAPRATQPDLTPIVKRRMQTLLLRLRNVGAWMQQPGTESELRWLAQELADISTRLEALEAGQDPAQAERGPVRRAVRSAQHNAPWPYALYIPHDYDPEKTYPLFVVLHGAGGNPDSMLMTACGAGEWGKTTLQGRRPFPDFPHREAFIVAPYAPTDDQPHDGYREYQQEVLSTIDAVREDFNIDERRVYLTGISMGGGGTWRIGLTYPDKFASIGPIASTLPLPLDQAGDAPHLPVVVFHGELDHVTSIRDIKAYVQRRLDAGGAVELREFQGKGHFLDLFGMDETFSALEASARQGLHP